MSNVPIRCYFPTNPSLPTKFDLKIVHWLSRKAYDVSDVVIVVGKGGSDQPSVDQRYALWSEYLKDGQFAYISVYKDEENSPLTAIYKMHERSPENEFSIAVPESIAKNETFQSHFELFPNYEIIITPNYDRGYSEKMAAAAANGDFREFNKYLPSELSLDRKQAILDMIKPEEPVLNEAYWTNMLNTLYTNYGLK